MQFQKLAPCRVQIQEKKAHRLLSTPFPTHELEVSAHQLVSDDGT